MWHSPADVADTEESGESRVLSQFRQHLTTESKSLLGQAAPVIYGVFREELLRLNVLKVVGSDAQCFK